MRRVEAILRPERLSHVVVALERLGVPGLTVSDVRGFGKGRGRGGTFEEGVLYLRRVRLEVVVPEEQVEPVLATILAEARTGRTGDGKIFVHPVLECVRIRTSERGREAL